MTTTMDRARAPAFRPGDAAALGTGTARPGWDPGTERTVGDGRSLARGLGWFSVGLGLAELAVPERVGAWVGMRGRPGLVRAYGAREVATGVGLLRRPRSPVAWVAGRIAGDALDLATLVALGGRNRKRRNAMAAAAFVAGAAALDLLCAWQLRGRSRAAAALRRPAVTS